MEMVFFVTLCLPYFYSGVTSEDRGTRVIFMLIFWVSFALGNLAKGPAPVFYVGLPAILYIAINKKWRVMPKLCLSREQSFVWLLFSPGLWRRHIR